jgi:hypothetical protein
MLAIASVVGVLAGCAPAESAEPDLSHADIANIKSLRSKFSPQFKVSDIAPAAIDPHLLETQPSADVKFDPADCEQFGKRQLLPDGVKGNMSAIVAEGEGNRFIAIAVETSEALPVYEPESNCQKVTYTSQNLRGLMEVVDAPKIDRVHTLGVHRVLQTTVNGETRTGELYIYVARFGPLLVIVTANPVVYPDKPTAPVDTKRAGELLTAGVAAVEG